MLLPSVLLIVVLIIKVETYCPTRLVAAATVGVAFDVLTKKTVVLIVADIVPLSNISTAKTIELQSVRNMKFLTTTCQH